MNGLPEEILRCFRADFTEHLTYEELQHLHLLKRTFEKKEKIHKINNSFIKDDLKQARVITAELKFKKKINVIQHVLAYLSMYV